MLTSSDDAGAFNNTLTLLVGLVSFSLSALLFFVLRESKQKSNNTPHPWPKVPGARFFIGNHLASGIGCIVDSLEEWARQYGSESGVYDCTLFGQTFVVICNEEKASLLDKNRPYKIRKKAEVSAALESIAGCGLFTAEGEEWRKDRRLVGPFLNRNHVKDYMPSLQLVAGRLVDKWEETMERDKIVKANSDLMSATLDVISLVAYAKDINSLLSEGGEGSRMAEDTKHLLGKSMYRILSPFPFWKIPIVGQYLDGSGWARSRVRKSLKRIVQDYETSSVSKSEAENKRSFLGKLIMQSKQENTHVDSDRLIGNLLTFFVAGSETTFVTIGSALYQLCIDETGLQEELAAEALAMKGLKTGADMDALNDGLPKLRSFMYEVLRIKGPASCMLMENHEPLEMDGVTLPPGTNFFWLLKYVTTLDPSKAQAEKSTPRGPRGAPLGEFCPRRWLIETNDKDGANNNIDGEDAQGTKLSVTTPSFQTGFRAFGSSLRVCPGRGLAEVQIMVFLAYIISKFEVELQKGHPEVKLVTKIAQALDTDVQLVLKPR